jgi:hypothetical protein
MSASPQIETKYPPGRIYRSAEFFVYSPNPVVVTLDNTNPVAQLAVQLQTDSDFELLAITQATDIAGAVQTDSSRVIPLATMTIVQSGTGNDIMPQPVPLSVISGDGRLPFLLPESKIWQGGSTMAITLTRYAVAGTSYNIRLAFIGRKLFYA